MLDRQPKLSTSERHTAGPSRRRCSWVSHSGIRTSQVCLRTLQMSRKDQSVLKFWDKFIKAYVSHHNYWYFPKARAVNNVAEVREIFRVLADFQGRPWKEVKPEFLKALQTKGLFERHAKEQSESDRLAMARILKV